MTTDCPGCDRIQAVTHDKTALCQRCAIEEMEARQWSLKQRIKKQTKQDDKNKILRKQIKEKENGTQRFRSNTRTSF